MLKVLLSNGYEYIVTIEDDNPDESVLTAILGLRKKITLKNAETFKTYEHVIQLDCLEDFDAEKLLDFLYKLQTDYTFLKETFGITEFCA